MPRAEDPGKQWPSLPLLGNGRLMRSDWVLGSNGTENSLKDSGDLDHQIGRGSGSLKYTRAFVEAWAEEEFVQAPLAQIGVPAASVQKFTLRESAHLKSNVLSAP